MKFIANNSLKQQPSAEIMALFPAEQARVAELFAQGVLQNLFVAADFSRAWLVFEGKNQKEVQRALESLPLYRFSNSELIPLAQES